MKKFPFETAQFVTSSLTPDSWPTLTDASNASLKEIAIAGRSNVGKSSLLNNLFLDSKLAKVSSTPGKTHMLNFFLIDNSLLLVDLPGYGYAKVSKQIKQSWSAHLDLYLQERKEISLFLLLLDIRRSISEEDLAFIEWARYHERPMLIIFTKCDKLKQHEVQKSVENNLMLLKNGDFALPTTYCLYSTKDPKSRIQLITMLNRYI